MESIGFLFQLKGASCSQITRILPQLLDYNIDYACFNPNKRTLVEYYIKNTNPEDFRKLSRSSIGVATAVNEILKYGHYNSYLRPKSRSL
jgi:hypothetical protein